eukprot:10598344-Heterocapsa_arctica.AAC.1
MKYQEKPQHFAAAAATVASTNKETPTATTGAHRSTRTLVQRASDESTIVPENFDSAASDSEWEGAEPATEEPLSQEPAFGQKTYKKIEDNWMLWAYSFSLEDDKMCPQKIQDPMQAYSTTLKEIQDRGRRRLM